MGVYKLSASGGLKTGLTEFSSMLAGNSIYDIGSMVPIASTPLTNAIVFSFGNIPQNYQDLFIVVNGVMNSTSAMCIDDINSGTAVPLSRTILAGNGSSAISERNTNATDALEFNSPSSLLVAGANSLLVHIPNYTSSTAFKTVLGRRASDFNGSGTFSIVVGTIRVTAPLTYFKFSSQNPACYFTSGFATLYGIRASA